MVIDTLEDLSCEELEKINGGGILVGAAITFVGGCAGVVSMATKDENVRKISSSIAVCADVVGLYAMALPTI